MITGSMRIGFYIFCKFHRPILQPIFDLLKDELPCFSTGDVNKVVARKPDIIVCADFPEKIFRSKLPETIIVWTRHGFSCKNYLQNLLAISDYVCVTSEWVRDDCLRRGWRPRLGFWATGYPPMDKLLRHEPPAGAILPAHFLPGDPIALYAPTFTPNLNAQEVLGNHWFASVRQDFPRLNIIIKPHPHTPKIFPEWMVEWKQVAHADRRVHLVEDCNEDIMEYLPLADILISDVSSVMFFYLALDRPIILVTNPARHKNPERYAPDAWEWTWRDMGIEVENEEQLLHAIRMSLQNPKQHSERRAFYRERVFGNNIDGNAAANVANKVRALAQPGPADQEWVNAAWEKIRGSHASKTVSNRT